MSDLSKKKKEAYQPLLSEETEVQEGDVVLAHELGQKHPYEASNLLSKIFYSWVTPLARHGRSNRLKTADLEPAMKWLNAEQLHDDILKNWNECKDVQKDPIFTTLTRTYKKMFLFAFIINFFQVCLDISVPFMLKEIIEFMQAPKGEGKPLGYGIFLICMYLIVDLVAKLLSQQGNFVQGLLGAKAYTGVVTIIYNKVLKCSSATNKSFSQGEIINFIQVDASKIQMLAWVLPTVSRLPIQLTFAIIYLIYFFGYSLLGAFGVAFVVVIINFFLATLAQKVQKIVLGRKDKRMRFTTEIINNIKIIKLNSWVKYFFDKVNEARSREVTGIGWGFYMFGANVFFMFALGPMLILSTYGIFFSTDHAMTLARGFAALQVLNSLNTPLRWIPSFIGTLLQFRVSMRRIQKFLLCDEINPEIVDSDSKEAQDLDVDILIENANFSWGGNKDEKKKDAKKEKSKPKPEESKEKAKENSSRDAINEDSRSESDLDETSMDSRSPSVVSSSNEEKIMKVKDSIQLTNLDLKIHKGEFICVIGGVGSGKSSLISALLGDMIYMDERLVDQYRDRNLDDLTKHEIIQKSSKYKGKVKLGSRVSYVQQIPWIQNKTIRDNILFDLPMDEEKYNKTIELCELGSDLEMLPGGDLTEIGEKGINLSGGQKARVSLARAVYADADILLMDDPISALDSNVKKKIFDNLFLNELKHKTRILVTHAVEFLHKVDRIIIMEKGKIKYIATYDDLQHSEEIQHIVESLSNISVHKDEGKKEKPEEGLEEESNSEENKEETSKVEKEEGKEQSVRKSFLSQKGRNITEDENEEQIQVGWGVYASYFLSRYTWVYLLILLPMSLAASFMMVQNGIRIGYWIRDSEDDNRFWKYFFEIMGLALGYAVLTTIVTTGVALVTLRIARLLHIEMLEKVTNAPINLYFDKTPSGRILNRFSSDLNKLDNAIHMKVSWTLNCFVMCSFDIYVAALNTPWVLALVPFVLLALVLLLQYYIKSFREVSRLASVTHSPLMNHLGETISGATTIRSFKKEAAFINDNYRYLNIVTNVGFWRESLRSWFAVRVEIISLTILAFTAGFLLAYKDKSDPILIGVMFNRFLSFNMMLMFGCSLLADLEGDLVSYDRCLKMMEIPQEAVARTGDPTLMNWPQWGEIEFRDYSLRYRPDTEIVLKNLSFSIKSREKIGIVGRTGAGKSTMCLALCRIVEADGGAIFIDGKDISSMGLEELREKITIIPQDPTLFEGTLRFNLDPVGSISDLELLEMARKASLQDLINRDERGLEQTIDDGGKNLSSGEKQLICICRAILRKNKVVLMDEATANIDIKTEQVIQKLILEEFTDSTVLTIAHRLNTIIHSDKVLVLSQGQIVEYDTPQALLDDTNSMFYSYAKELKRKEKKEG